LGQPVFTLFNGQKIPLEPGAFFSEKFCKLVEQQPLVPLFIGEAAYIEKNIAFATAQIFNSKNSR